ncbi:hypothetical protein ABTM82_20105, partial [Acinetobacter baumannii]
DDGSQYFYSVKPVEMNNILGTSVAILNEYFITNSDGENYKLYKTNEGNWYEISEVNKDANKSVLLKLKLAIDAQTTDV